MDKLDQEWIQLHGYIERMLLDAKRKYGEGIYPNETIRYQKRYARMSRDFSRITGSLEAKTQTLKQKGQEVAVIPNLDEKGSLEFFQQIFELNEAWNYFLFTGMRDLYRSLERNFSTEVATDIVTVACTTHAQGIMGLVNPYPKPNINIPAPEVNPRGLFFEVN